MKDRWNEELLIFFPQMVETSEINLVQIFA